MTITKIIYHCPNSSMGDNVTDADADGYREWVKAELSAEFPGVDITVTDEQHTANVQTDAGADDYDALERVQMFVHEAWDRCDWYWV